MITLKKDIEYERFLIFKREYFFEDKTDKYEFMCTCKTKKEVLSYVNKFHYLHLEIIDCKDNSGYIIEIKEVGEGK